MKNQTSYQTKEDHFVRTSQVQVEMKVGTNMRDREIVIEIGMIVEPLERRERLTITGMSLPRAPKTQRNRR